MGTGSQAGKRAMGGIGTLDMFDKDVLLTAYIPATDRGQAERTHISATVKSLDDSPSCRTSMMYRKLDELPCKQ